MTEILLIDDDLELSEMLTEYLAGEAFSTTTRLNGAEGVAAVNANRYAAVILDVMLPDMTGLDALRLIRRTSAVPVIMLTAKGSDLDRVLGLELGADDYIAKPYYPPELVARLRAVLRRSSALPINEPQDFGKLHFDKGRREVSWDGTPLELTTREFGMLELLLINAELVLKKDELSRLVLGRPREAYDRGVDVHINNLRKKLRGVTSGELEIETVYGVGYRLKWAA